MRTILLLLAVLTPLTALASGFPKIPPSTRVLTAEEVQHYWFNTLRSSPKPKRPSGLYPLQQRVWDREREAEKAKLRAIIKGTYHTDALLAALAHNVEVYRALKNWEALAATQTELQQMLEHQAKLALLKAQQESAERVAQAAEREAQAAERAARAAEQAAAQPECPQEVEVVVVHEPAPTVVIPSIPSSPQPAPPAETLFPRINRSR